MALNPQQMATDCFHQATESMDRALKMTAKFQEDTMQWWAGMMGGASSIQDWQERAQSMAMNAIPTAQKSAGEYVRAMDQAYRTGMDLLHEAFSSGEVHSIGDVQGRVQTLWEHTLGTLRTNTQGFIEANSKAMESWAALVHNGRSSKVAEPA